MDITVRRYKLFICGYGTLKKYVIRERYPATGKMDNIKDVKLSSLGDSNYVKPLRMHYTQACIVSTHIPKQECCMIWRLGFRASYMYSKV